MAKARVIIKRRKAVRNIRKITKVMQMISSARYQKAYRRAMGTKPYVAKINEIVASTVQAVRGGGGAGKPVGHPLLQNSPVGLKKTAILLLTSNRGLCGGYNGNVQRLAVQTYRALAANGDSPEIYVAGKKGVSYVRFHGFKAAATYTQIGDNPRFADIELLAEMFMKQYTDGQISGLKLVYTRFLSAGHQKPAVVDVLPLGALGGASEDPTGAVVAYDFSPDPEEMLTDLIPRTVKITIFQAFIEAAVSEQIARMVAMKAATDNAEKLGRKLTQDYNRARQSQITSELSELMGGVEAMK
jgi:F-type H+-transporting ATPase subunit gamma